MQNQVPRRIRGKYTAQLAKLDAPKLYKQLDFKSEFSDRDHVVVPALGERIDHGTILAYLFRRFGYPNSGWNPDVAIARYLLTTPNPAMILCIEPHITGYNLLSFCFMVEAQLMPILDVGTLRPAEINMWSKKDPLRPLAEAAWETLEDLLTPVAAGLMAINVKGCTDEEWPPQKPCLAAGYASGDLGNSAPGEFAELQNLITELGGGDSKAGVQKAISILKGATVPTAVRGLASANSAHRD